ncbi:MAG: PQQ-binding-like beta-propeller repeat protein, partial [Acidimicrobiales bacterium]
VVKRAVGRMVGVAAAVAMVTGGLSTFLATVPAQAAVGDVPTFLGGGTHANYNAAETQITPVTASALARHWLANSHAGGYVASQPVVAGGVVYWGDSDGYEHATNATTGAELWSSFLGTSGVLDPNPANCNPTRVGVAGAATVASVGAKQLVFVPGGGNMPGPQGTGVYYYALNAADGSVAWQTMVGTGPTTQNHSDPAALDVLWSSSVLSTTGTPALFVGVAAHGSCSGWTQGRVLKLDAAAGGLLATTYLSQGCLGSDVWGTPTLDEAAGMVYVSTGEADWVCAAATAQPYADAIVKLQMSDLTIVDHWQLSLVTDPYIADHDFGSTPTLFSGGGKSLVGEVNKNGTFYAWDRANLAAGPVWTYQFADPGNGGPESGDGSIAPAAYDGTNLYVAGGYKSGSNQTCPGTLQSLDPATGTPHWQDCVAGAVLPAPAAAPGVVAIGAGAHLEVIRSSDGAVLFDQSYDSPSSWYWAAPTVANGWLYAANSSGRLYGLTINAPGYWMLGANGSVYTFGDARYLGVARPVAPAVHLEPTPDAGGYWILDSGGHVYTFGDAGYFGGAAGRLAPFEVATSLSRTASGNGYWIFTNRGRALTFGDATFYGDMSGVALNGPVVGSVTTPSGNGYFMVATDGGVFTFGDAAFLGSMGATRLNAPVNSLVPTADGRGYWLVAGDGGIFTFGDAPFRGSMGAVRLNKPVIGMVRYGTGYLMVASDGGIFDFSELPFLGSLGANPPPWPIVGVAPTVG